MSANKKRNRRPKASRRTNVTARKAKRQPNILHREGQNLSQKETDNQATLTSEDMKNILGNIIANFKISADSLNENNTLTERAKETFVWNIIEKLPIKPFTVIHFPKLEKTAQYSKEKSVALDMPEVDETSTLTDKKIENTIEKPPQEDQNAKKEESKVTVKKIYNDQSKVRVRPKPNIFQFLIGKYRKQKQYTNPYSDGLEHFIKRVVPLDEEQGDLMEEYMTYPEFENCIEEMVDNKGNVIEYKIKNEKEYHKQKKALGLE